MILVLRGGGEKSTGQGEPGSRGNKTGAARDPESLRKGGARACTLPQITSGGERKKHRRMVRGNGEQKKRLSGEWPSAMERESQNWAKG